MIVASTVQPGVSATGTAPSQTAPPSSVPGVCNSYLPEDTTLNRFLFVVNFYAANGFYIILDNQFNLDQTAINDQQQWLSRVRDQDSSDGSQSRDQLIYAVKEECRDMHIHTTRSTDPVLKLACMTSPASSALEPASSGMLLHMGWWDQKLLA